MMMMLVLMMVMTMAFPPFLVGEEDRIGIAIDFAVLEFDEHGANLTCRLSDPLHHLIVPLLRPPLLHAQRQGLRKHDDPLLSRRGRLGRLSTVEYPVRVINFVSEHHDSRCIYGCVDRLRKRDRVPPVSFRRLIDEHHQLRQNRLLHASDKPALLRKVSGKVFFGGKHDRIFGVVEEYIVIDSDTLNLADWPVSKT